MSAGKKYYKQCIECHKVMDITEEVVKGKKEVVDDLEKEILKYNVNEFPSVVRMTKTLIELKLKHLGKGGT